MVADLLATGLRLPASRASEREDHGAFHAAGDQRCGSLQVGPPRRERGVDGRDIRSRNRGGERREPWDAETDAIAMKCCEKSSEKRLEVRHVLADVENVRVSVDSEEEGLSHSSLERSFMDDSLSATSTAMVVIANKRR
ncbi:hypothetical protein DH2020_044150 [Rehmannia glutinosa]|uniref:Uncharacterized protein n=1 Tax=Rehmannia glutinosa TaxID=99300 RepID=A0ABR0UHP6_REHGL